MIIKKDHPYIYLPNINLQLKAKNNPVMYQSILEQANNDLDEPLLYPKDPNGWLYEILDKTKERILRNCIVYKITNEKKYLESMKKQLFYLIDKWPWIERYHKKEIKLHADLRTGIIMYTLGLVYDWMYHDFTELERLKIFEAITIRGYDLLKKDIKQDAFYLTSYGNNWLAIMLGGYCVAALATYHECDYSKDIYKLAIKRTKIMSETLGNDGAWEEGPGYWGGISFMVMFFDILSSVDNAPNFNLRDSIMHTPLFPIYMNMPPNGRANFSDAHYPQDYNSIYIFATIARIYKNPYYQWAFLEFRKIAKESKSFLRKIKITDFRLQEETYSFLSYDKSITPKYPIIYDTLKVFQGSNYGFLSSRNGFGRQDTGTIVCANAGTNGTNHHQLDIGQVIITSNMENYICDPGYGLVYYFKDKTKATMENYFAKNSFGHNIVTIGNNSQKDGEKAKGKIVESFRKNDTNYFTIELTKAYRNVKNAYRKIIHKDNMVIVYDDFTLISSDTAMLRWFFNGNLFLTNGKFIIDGNDGKCIGEVTSINSQLQITSSYYSDEGCLDRAGELLPPIEYPYMQFKLGKSKHHIFKTTFTFIKK
ncbi:MAG: heparinase II/III family protein [Clostridiales bacterium]|nr:heparinase II/III family protein [Clostridiales bacterium]